MLCVEKVAVAVGDKTLLHDVSFTAEPGKVTGLIGPNGAGKSTLLAAMAGDLQPAAGSVSLCGVDPYRCSQKELARKRSVMLQDVAVSFSFLVRDVVQMGRRPWEGTDRADADDMIIDAAMQATEVDHLCDRDVVTLSGGERARVALARVLAQQTPVVFLDEPTAALDIGHQEQALGLIRAMAQSGAAVVVVLHDLNAAASYCDEIVCLANGGVAAAGSVEEVFQTEILSEVYGWPIQVLYAGGFPHVIPQRGEVASHHQEILSVSHITS